MNASEVILSSDVLARMLAHCAEASPREAVGLLGGQPGRATDVALPLINVALRDREFIADPYSQFRAFQHLEMEELELRAIYHSHPGGGIQPSPKDLAYARLWPCAHIIVALSESTGAWTGLGGFRQNPNRLEHVDVILA